MINCRHRHLNSYLHALATVWSHTWPLSHCAQRDRSATNAAAWLGKRLESLSLSRTSSRTRIPRSEPHMPTRPNCSCMCVCVCAVPTVASRPQIVQTLFKEHVSVPPSVCVCVGGVGWQLMLTEPFLNYSVKDKQEAVNICAGERGGDRREKEGE